MIDIKKYINENIPYNKKWAIKKTTTLRELYDLYFKKYKNDFIELPLKVNDQYKLHINFKILEPIVNEFLSISNTIENKKDIIEKVKSSLTHEIYNNLLIEGYISSRKIIKDVVNRKNDKNADIIIKNISNSMIYISQNRKINKENLLFLYKSMTNDIEMGKETLDGNYYRNDNVSIGETDKGIAPDKIDEYMNLLFEYINSDLHNEESNIIIKIIIIHFYFEYIHPYYDFNGRTGRMLVLWFAYNNDIYKDFAFFSTSIAAYKDQYLKVFKETRYANTIDITYFVANILYILIKQKEHYSILMELENYVVNKKAKKLSSIQKDIIMFDLATRDIYNLDKNSAISISKIIKNYSEYSVQLIYREINNLQELGILKKVDKRDVSYYIKYDVLNKK